MAEIIIIIILLIIIFFYLSGLSLRAWDQVA